MCVKRLGILILLLSLFSTLSFGDDLDDWLRGLAAESHGKVLKPEAYPKLYSFMNEVLVELNKSLNKPPHNGAKSKRYLGLFLIDSEDTFGYSAKIRPQDADDSPYAIAVSTGFIREQFSDLITAKPSEKKQKILDGLQRIIGVLGHGTAHRSELAKDESGTSQFEEARADALAIELLRKHNYSRTAPLNALEKASSLERDMERDGTWGVVDAAFSSHPTGELRLA